MANSEDQRRRPSFKQIAERLKDRLYTETDEPNELGHGCVLTIPYEKFYDIVNRNQLRGRLCIEVVHEASLIGLVVAFGHKAVVVATDENFVEGGWSSLDAKRQRNERARALFSRIKNKKKVSS